MEENLKLNMGIKVRISYAIHIKNLYQVLKEDYNFEFKLVKLIYFSNLIFLQDLFHCKVAH